jgi:hypothetical protein
VIVFQADNSLASKQLEGRKQNKERITLAIYYNGDGSDRLPLWVIGKYKNPRCFKNINKNTFGCQYWNNSSAWMTRIFFLKWLKGFDLHVSRRKVLLIMDNFSGHIPLDQLPNHIQLRNTTVFYLPPNATSKIQPCDAGIICNFKAYYHRHFNRLLLQRLEDNVTDLEKIDILCAIQMVVRAWTYKMKPETIFNCFRHCKIRSTEEPVVDASEECPLDPEVIKDLESQIWQFHYHNPMDIRNMLNYPEEHVTAYTPNVDDVIEDQLQERSSLQVEVNNDEANDSQELPVVSDAEAYKMVEMLERFWM